MTIVQLTQSPGVESKFDSYPTEAKNQMKHLRSLILEVAEESASTSKLEETLKWGEPSYVTKHGSTIRIDWKARAPEQYAMYFNCNTSLVETFKMSFGTIFIHLALNYHLVKDKPFLGM